jgi:ankyrin repeat protein
MKVVGRRTSDLEAIVTRGDLNALRRALMAGADPNRLGQHGWSPAWEAIRRGRADQLELLLAYGAALAPEGLPEGTLLHVAAFWGTPACIDVLLAAGADVSAVDATGETALCHAVRAANVDNVRRLLDAQAVVMPRPDTPEGSVPTLLAEDDAQAAGRVWGDPDAEAEKLAQAQWRDGGPDAVAAWQCALLVARHRLAAANPDAAVGEAEVLLQHHAGQGDVAAVETALAAGANPTIRDATAGRSLLASAIDRGDARLVALLLDAGAEPDWYGYYTWGDTPLIAAAREGHREICALLLAAGADPDIHLWTGETAADVTTDPVIRDLLAAVKA